MILQHRRDVICLSNWPLSMRRDGFTGCLRRVYNRPFRALDPVIKAKVYATLDASYAHEKDDNKDPKRSVAGIHIHIEYFV